MTEKKHTEIPGRNWRLTHREDGRKLEHVGTGTFDELTVDGWLHIEQLEERVWWMRVGDARLTFSIEADGQASVDVQRGFYGEVRGKTSEHKAR